MAAPEEIAIPFGVASDGGIAIETSPDRQVYQHVRSLVATSLNERPMYTGYGCGLLDLMFEPGDNFVEMEVSQQISDALVRWEPSLVGTYVRPVRNVTGDGIASIEVLFSRNTGRAVPVANVSQVNTAVVRVGGQVLEKING